MAKPTIAFVPGAWLTPEPYEPLLGPLRNKGYPVASGKFPSVGSADPKSQSVAADCDFIRREILEPQLEKGKDVILFMHSYGGLPGSAAAKGLSKAERAAAGQKGGVVGLVFMCAFVGTEGTSLTSKLPNEELPAWNIVNEETGQLDVEKPEEIFFNGGAERAAAEMGIGKPKHQQAKAAFTTPSPPTAWPDAVFDGRRAYIKCALDNAIPIAGQDAMLEASGVSWHELRLEDAGHSPFLTHVEAVVGFVDERAAEWMA